MKPILIFIYLSSITYSLLGHSGRTDSKGGHHDRINGGYHYHHGNGPHQHINGVCELTLRKNSYSSTKGISNQGRNYQPFVIVGVLGLGIGYFFRKPQNLK